MENSINWVSIVQLVEGISRMRMISEIIKKKAYIFFGYELSWDLKPMSEKPKPTPFDSFFMNQKLL